MTDLVTTSYGRNTLRRLRSELRIMEPSATPGLAAAWELDPVAPTPTLMTGDLPDLSLADLVAVSPLPAAAVLCALHDVAATLDAVYDSGLAHGDLRASTIYVLPDGRAVLARPDAPPAVKRNGRGRARQDDNHAFAALAAELLADPPEAAATVLEDALKVDISRRPVPRTLLAALDEIPAEDWSSNNLQRRVEAEPAAPAIRLGSWPPAEPAPAPVPEPVPVIRLGSWPPSMPATFTASPAPAAMAATSRIPFIPEGVEERQRQRPPKRERTLFRRIMEPAVVLVGLVTVVAAGGGGAKLLLDPASAGDSVAQPPEVRRMSVSITPPQAQCPRAAMHVAATIVLDGGEGDLVVRWRLPDGSVAETQTLSIDEGQTTTRTAIDLTLTGTDPVLGNIVAIVSPAGVRASAPIRYVCPSSVRNSVDRARDA